jgi:hypothetical protein
MKRIAKVCAALSVILLVYGLIDFLTNYNWAQGDQDPLFGNGHILLNDGATVMIAGGFLTISSVIMWVIAIRQEHGNQPQP